MRRLLIPWILLIGTGVFGVEPYLRIGGDAEGARCLEIAVRTLRNGEGRRVHLVGVSHVGTQRYYDELQVKLDGMDRVLFEGIGGDRPEFLNRDPAMDADALQPALARAAGLKFQLHAIDYTRPHFVNSDVSPGELLALFSGENPGDLTPEGLERMEATMEAMQGEGMPARVMRALLGMVEQHPPLALGVRWAMVEILGSVRGNLAEIQGLPGDVQQMMRVLLEKRNAVVLRDVGAALADPEGPAELGIFYGAAHMHELEEQLREAYGFVPERTEWLVAFSGDLSRSGLGPIQRNVLRHVVRQQVALMEGLMGGE